MKVMEILKDSGITELRPPQKKTIEYGLLDYKNILACISTSAGKTLIGEMALINHLLNSKKEPTNKKGLFIVPLKALASEKYKEFKEKYKKYGLKVGLSIGDYTEKKGISNYDLIITTSEKLDSILRHEPDFIDQISVVVIDEIHLIGDAERGGTLEVILTKLKQRDIQIVGLSATIGNPEELANWLNASLVLDDWRPIELKKGYSVSNRDKQYVIFDGNEVKEVLVSSSNPVQNLVVDAIKLGGSSLVFCNTKRGAVAEAKKLDMSIYLSGIEKMRLKTISDEIHETYNTPTKTCKDLASCIKKGVAFHHAGLPSNQRRLVEDAFREKLIKVICCTPTLAVGINAPCRRAIVRDTKRWNGKGLIPIPKMEIQQCLGRAGRPGLDPYGEGIILAKENDDIKDIENYLSGEVETIYSRLSNEKVLRKHSLGLIASGEVCTILDIEDFIQNTFYSHQYGSSQVILDKLEEILELFEFGGFIECSQNMIIPTKLGKRISELYIDPYSAELIIEGLTEINELQGIDLEFYMLYLISQTTEIPLLHMRTVEDDKSFFTALGIRPDEFQQKAYNIASLLYDWINEVSEVDLYNKYRVEPGVIRYIVDNAKWMAYSTYQMMSILDIANKEYQDIVKDLEFRLEYGAKREIIELLYVKHIGRVRARVLYEAGVKFRDELYTKSSLVASLIGEKITKKVLKEEFDLEYGQQKLLVGDIHG